MTGIRHNDWQRCRAYRSCSINIVDPSRVAHVRTGGADRNNVVSRGHRTPRGDTQSDVVIAGGVAIERTVADGCIANAGGVAR